MRDECCISLKSLSWVAWEIRKLSIAFVIFILFSVCSCRHWLVLWGHTFLGCMSSLSNIILCDQDILQGKATTLESISSSIGPSCLCIGGKGGKSTDFAPLQCDHPSSAPGPLIWSRRVVGAAVINWDRGQLKEFYAWDLTGLLTKHRAMCLLHMCTCQPSGS